MRPACLHRLLETHMCVPHACTLLEIASFPCYKAAEEATKLILDQSRVRDPGRPETHLTHAGDRRDTLSGVLLRSLWRQKCSQPGGSRPAHFLCSYCFTNGIFPIFPLNSKSKRSKLSFGQGTQSQDSYVFCIIYSRTIHVLPPSDRPRAELGGVPGSPKH